VLGNRILAQIQRNNERRIQQTYEELVEAEQQRMEDEYRQKSDEMIRQWQAQLDEEKLKLQEVIVCSSSLTKIIESTIIGFQ
jgi:hypothetical protein